jgi:hypothetical protein
MTSSVLSAALAAARQQELRRPAVRALPACCPA